MNVLQKNFRLYTETDKMKMESMLEVKNTKSVDKLFEFEQLQSI